MDTETERASRGEEGQMAVEMALLLPVYFLLMFVVFVYSDWFRVVNSLDQASYNLTRGDGAVQQNHVQPYFGSPIDDFGTLEEIRTPSFQDGGARATDLFTIKFQSQLGGGNADSCSDAKLSDAGALQIGAIALYLNQGVRRNDGGRSYVSFRYDNHRYWNAYDSSWTRPQPLLHTSASGTYPSIGTDTTRHNGKWYSHPIQGNFEFQLTRFIALVEPHRPIPHNFLVSNAYYKRHLGWLGYDWSFLSNPMPMVDALNPMSPDTYHPRLYQNNNYLHFNTLIRLGF